MSRQPVFPKVRALAGRLAFLPLAIGASFLFAWCQETSDLRPDQAVELYDQARYEESQAILEELDAEGKATGPLLYRLSFCLRSAGDREEERRVLARAISTLEQEAQAATALEVPFYLANAYRNVGRVADARQAAATATAKVESGEIKGPEHPMEMFRLAKLYADQQKEHLASEWYRKSLDGFAKLDEQYPANVRWAQRYLAERSYSKTDYAEAEEAYAELIESGNATQDDYDRLAVARVRQKQWKKAAEAWEASAKLDPARADRPRYCAKLAVMADSLGELPEKAPSGQAWEALSKEDLEALLSGQAEVVKSAIEAVKSGEAAAPAAREKLEQEVAVAKAVFTKAGIEYAVRNHPIRETAFMGGYAPLIFHADRWKLPPAE